jgi:hypothetical protein
VAAPLGWNPTLREFADMLARPPFNVKHTEFPGATGYVRQAYFIRSGANGTVYRAIHPAVWDMVMDPTLVTDLLGRLGIDSADYAHALNDLAEIEDSSSTAERDDESSE